MLDLISRQSSVLAAASEQLKAANLHELVGRAAQVMNELKERSRELDRLNQKLADSKIDGLFEQTQTAAWDSVLHAMFSGTNLTRCAFSGTRRKSA